MKKTVSWSALETWWAPDGSASQSPHVKKKGGNVKKKSIETSDGQSRVMKGKVAVIYKA